ncbi:hypothetical protein KJ733_02355 [Patescibacteria group bacterium]|nr:hypothetical protein [Patescibacteria group bacterium]
MSREPNPNTSQMTAEEKLWRRYERLAEIPIQDRLGGEALKLYLQRLILQTEGVKAK